MKNFDNLNSNNEATKRPLEEILIAFQKSLARVNQNMSSVQNSELDLIAGRRTLFAIDTLDVELTLMADTSLDNWVKSCDRVWVEMSSKPELGNLKLSFRVTSKPIEPLGEPRLLLSQFKPISSKISEYWYIASWIGENNEPITDGQLKVKFLPSNPDLKPTFINIQTNAMGKAIFMVNAKNGTIFVERAKKSVNLKCISKFAKSEEWYINAETEGRKSQVEAKEGEGAPKRLLSEIFSLRRIH